MTPTEASPSARGDRLARKSRRWAGVALAAFVVTLPCVLFIQPLWAWLVTLGPGSFMLVAGVWGLILAAGPLLLLAGMLCALFLRVEAAFTPRTRATPRTDRAIIALACVVSLLPALAALYTPVKALLTGFIGFRGLGQQYPLSSDPYGYWQAVAFWLMGAASLAVLAGVYWRAKWRQARRRRLHTDTTTPQA
ncbi:MAG: hypothetical protein REI09_13285 [Candidatus Dactylopiibacterium sp.]|nr:hypothetical protein [Candidatus Dactylopiibacterium sp.]